MRTKTLLIAAAALAAGVLTSSAQTYSQNVVGYVNQVFPSGVYTVVTPPLQATSTNAPEDILPALQTGDSVLYWNGTSFQTYTFFSPGQWLYPDGSTVGPAPNIPVGTAFFYLNGQASPETNTFTGTVVLNNTNSPVTLASGVYAFVGSTPPIGVSSLEDTNLNLPLQAGDAVLTWNGVSYQTYTFFGPGQWLYPDGSTIGASPALQVGQGFLYLNGQSGNETWTQNLILQ